MRKDFHPGRWVPYMFETFHTPERLPAQNLHVSNFHRSLFGPKLPARSDQHVRGVVTKEMKGKSSTSMTACSFDHITVCSFMPLLGEPLPPGVICPFKKVNTHWFQEGQYALAGMLAVSSLLRPRLRFSDPAQFHGHASPLLFETHAGTMARPAATPSSLHGFWRRKSSPPHSGDGSGM